jgi:hypothetical protein
MEYYAGCKAKNYFFIFDAILSSFALRVKTLKYQKEKESERRKYMKKKTSTRKGEGREEEGEMLIERGG